MPSLGQARLGASRTLEVPRVQTGCLAGLQSCTQIVKVAWDDLPGATLHGIRCPHRWCDWCDPALHAHGMEFGLARALGLKRIGVPPMD